MLAARHNPEYSFFASKLISADNPRVLDGAGDNYHVSGLVWRRGHGNTAQGEMNAPREVFAPCAAAALYRRSALIDVGGFDEDFFCYVEDVDLGFRLRLAGHRCLYVPQAVVTSCRIGDNRGKKRFLCLPRSPELGVDVCERHAGRLVLVAVAAACVAQPADHRLVCVAGTGW